jgi:hypothetical protein
MHGKLERHIKDGMTIEETKVGNVERDKKREGRE